MGDLSSAQKFAFEGYVSSVDGNPRLLQRLVQTNILTGAYAVAEKYIRILEQTLFYKEWAAEWRKYLYRDILSLQSQSFLLSACPKIRRDVLKCSLCGLIKIFP